MWYRARNCSYMHLQWSVEAKLKLKRTLYPPSLIESRQFRAPWIRHCSPCSGRTYRQVEASEISHDRFFSVREISKMHTANKEYKASRVNVAMAMGVVSCHALQYVDDCCATWTWLFPIIYCLQHLTNGWATVDRLLQAVWLSGQFYVQANCKS